jgi:DNA-binding CsgD family transcriptional regulator/disulfide oxidoreductase YuzD
MRQDCFDSQNVSSETSTPERKQVQEKLEEVLHRLDITHQQSIIYANETNRKINERKRAEAERIDRDDVLQSHQKSLDEIIAALQILLQDREEDKNRLEEKVTINMKTLILPCIDALKHTRLDQKQKSLIDLVETRLGKIVSPYLVKFKAKNSELTPKEIQVAALIKDDKTTKEMAEMMHISTRAIEFHRQNIRKKLGLIKSKTNLKTYLLSQK